MIFKPSLVFFGQTTAPSAFGWIDYAVLGSYLLLLVGIGVYFSRRESTTDDYFRAGGRIPWWAAGISIFGTQLSAITFMAVPAKTYATDWSYLMLNMTILLVAPLITAVFLPLFRRLNLTTAYEYLEKRFNLTTRLLGSVMFIVLQLGRIGIVLLLPSLALSLVVDIGVSECIIVMGGLSIVYTILGGIEAVIWTDVLQVVVLLGGALLCLLLIMTGLDGGPGEFWQVAQDANKLRTFDFRWDWTDTTFGVVLLGGLGANLVSYGSDQTVVQRYLTTKDEASARRSIWMSAALSVPGTLLFFGMGTALYVFYQAHPGQLDDSLTNVDAIFPFYIVTQLPSGVSGLLIAGVFAAAMLSLDSSMNAVATVVTTDFYQRLFSATEASSMRVARWTTGIVGAGGTAFALVMATWEIQSLWDQLNTFIGLFAGGLAGVFLLGILTKRTNGTGAVTGLVASGLVQFSVKAYTSLSFLLYTATGIASCMVVGYLISRLTGFFAPSRRLDK